MSVKRSGSSRISWLKTADILKLAIQSSRFRFFDGCILSGCDFVQPDAVIVLVEYLPPSVYGFLPELGVRYFEGVARCC